MACDVDVRAALLQNIVVVGNTSLTRGLVERLDVELAGLMPSVCLHLPTFSHSGLMKSGSKRSRSTPRLFRSSVSTLHGLADLCWRVWERFTSFGLPRMSMRSMV